LLHIALHLRRRTILLLTLWPEPPEPAGEPAPDQRGTAMLAAGEIATPMAEPDTFGLRPTPVRASTTE
jgi:hypothetical protein